LQRLATLVVRSQTVDSLEPPIAAEFHFNRKARDIGGEPLQFGFTGG
jgi:hypothetical protein